MSHIVCSPGSGYTAHMPIYAGVSTVLGDVQSQRQRQPPRNSNGQKTIYGDNATKASIKCADLCSEYVLGAHVQRYNYANILTHSHTTPNQCSLLCSSPFLRQPLHYSIHYKHFSIEPSNKRRHDRDIDDTCTQNTRRCLVTGAPCQIAKTLPVLDMHV